MSGNYPDPPAAHRMAWDRDGTIFVTLRTDTGAVTTRTQTEMNNVNDQDTDQVNLSTTSGMSIFKFCLIFPELRDITHYAIGATFGGGVTPGTLQWSPDTTNGFDGTWNTVASPWVNKGTNVSLLRSPDAVTINGAKAVRWGANSGSFTQDFATVFAHFYGGPAAGQNPDRLRLWHPSSDAEMLGPNFEFGNIARSTSADKTFRIKNNSATLTANGVVLSLGALTDTSPSVPGQYLLSQDGVNFAATQNIGNLAPGAISGVMTLRRVTPSNAVLGLWWARVLAVATSWT